MRTRKHRPTARRDAGFSIIEALIAAAILLIIALGLLPLFSRSINDNVTGNDATQATNVGRTRIEDLLHLPIKNKKLEIPSASAVGELKESWTMGDPQKTGDADEGWWKDPAGHGTVLWIRTTRVSLYDISDLDDGVLNSPLNGSSSSSATISFKQIQVEVENPKKNLLGNGQGITLQTIKYD
jgi:type II secretory pathway pseudopilin PulG